MLNACPFLPCPANDAAGKKKDSEAQMLRSHVLKKLFLLSAFSKAESFQLNDCIPLARPAASEKTPEGKSRFAVWRRSPAVSREREVSHPQKAVKTQTPGVCV